MTVLSNRDYLKVKLSGLIADYDRDTIVNLYQPIIGYTAVAIYFSLWSLTHNKEKYCDVICHESLFTRMQIAPGKFIEARKMLEATGLIKTYVKNDSEGKVYSYIVYAPKAPKNFFENILLYGMLVKCVGEQEANKIKSEYIVSLDDEIGEDISEKFSDVFNPSYDDPTFVLAARENNHMVGRNIAKIKSNFSYELFFKELRNISSLNEASFSSKEMKEVERLALLYGVCESDCAKYVSNCYNGILLKGKRLNIENLSKLFQEDSNLKFISNIHSESKPNYIKSSTKLASKINLMESISPKDYLSVLQNGNMPAKSDLKIIDDISKNFNLSNSVINAIIDFVLASNNNIFTKSYAEKIAASLARADIKTTIDAMNYLKDATSKKKTTSEKQTTFKNSFTKTSIKEETKIKDENIENDDDSYTWNDLIEELSEEVTDGKA